MTVGHAKETKKDGCGGLRQRDEWRQLRRITPGDKERRLRRATLKETGGTVTAESHRGKGSRYEKLAAGYLKEHGYEILEMNYRCRRGEVDIVARDGAYLVFVEVKYRADGRRGHPAEAVTPKKQQTISFVAMHYCASRHVSGDTPIRFDVVAILREEIVLFVNAFPFCCRVS